MIPAVLACLCQRMTPLARIDATWRRRSTGSRSAVSRFFGMGRLHRERPHGGRFDRRVAARLPVTYAFHRCYLAIRDDGDSRPAPSRPTGGHRSDWFLYCAYRKRHPDGVRQRKFGLAPRREPSAPPDMRPQSIEPRFSAVRHGICACRRVAARRASVAQAARVYRWCRPPT